MNFLNAIFSFFSIIIHFSFVLALYYLWIAIKNIKKHPPNIYQISMDKFLYWLKWNNIFNIFLSILYLLLSIYSFKNINIGIATSLIGIVIVYILRIINNIKRIR